jgi:hypothetical protein
MPRLLIPLAVAGICAALLTVTVRSGSFVAGGSDSSCYVLQAERWAAGRLLVPDPLALAAPWPDAERSFAPAGHFPAPTMRGAVAPICPSGLSMLMAPFRAIGGRTAMFLVFPLCGVLLVSATYLLGARLHAGVGLASALVVASNPIVLYQAVQPMSDVPGAALWTLAVVMAVGREPRAAFLAGVSAALAILVRPNLLPLGVVLGVYLLLQPDRTWRGRVTQSAVYAALCAVGCAVVALVQWHFYGSPLASGYGAVGDIFALAHVAPNAARYGSWLLQTQTPLVLLSLAAPFVLPRGFATLGLAYAAVTAGVYLPYLVFEDWSYVRFLLPAVPVLTVLTLGTVAALMRRCSTRQTATALGVVAVGLAAYGVWGARTHQAFALRQLESVYARSGIAVDGHVPANALVITSRYSGSVRYYAGRDTIVWDALDPASLDRAVAFARSRGLEPFFMLDSGEEAAFRSRFAGSDLARLDWPPLLEIAPQVRVYQPAARARYLAGQSIATEYVR